MTSYFLLARPNRYKQYRETRRTTHLGGRITGAIILHSAENATDLVGEDTGAEGVARYIRDTRTDPGSYHVLVDRDSTIRMAPYEYEVWHDTTSNNYAIGISVAWRKSDLPKMTKAQREAYYRPFARAVLDAVDWVKRNRGIAVPIDRFRSRAEIVAGKPGLSTHSRMDPSRRSDPFGTGSVYEREFLAILAEEAGRPAPKPSPSTGSSSPSKAKPGPTPSAPASEPRTYAVLRVDGVRGPLTRRAWQILLKYVAQPRRYSGRIDGVYGPMSNKAEQTWLAALGYYKGRIDGVRGPVHIKALQSFLRKKGLYSGRIDGIEGPLTVKAEQRYLNDQRRYL